MDIWNLKGGQLKILGQGEIEEIHQRALDVLQRVGCFFDHEEAIAIFAEHDVVVDKSSRIVKLPRNMVEEAIREVARDKAREILSTHQVEPLPREVQEELQGIIKNAEETYGK